MFDKISLLELILAKCRLDLGGIEMLQNDKKCVFYLKVTSFIILQKKKCKF
jgi:hypothetical protein